MCGKSRALRNLKDRIAQEIATSGPMTFAHFMEVALYDQEAGYYAAGRAKIGRLGDFYTSVSVGPIFGEILASQFLEMWEHLGRPADFTLVEQGANDGRLAADIRAALQATPLHDVRYIFVEPSATLRQEQRTKVAAGDWVDKVEDLPDFVGVHFSNELFDALPFHLAESDGETWQELFVSGSADDLTFTRGNPSPDIVDVLHRYPLPEPGRLVEIRVSHQSLLAAISRKLQHGFLLMIDYGMSTEVRMAPHRSRGTFACFKDHRRDDFPLQDVGEKDITAHVDFSEFLRDASAVGFDVVGFNDQHRFLVGAAEELLRAMDGQPQTAESQKRLRQLQTLLHPETMGRNFHAVALSRNLATPPSLRGFRYGNKVLANGELINRQMTSLPEG